MNRRNCRFLLFFVTGSVFLIHGLRAQDSYSIATYTIRYDNPTDTANQQEQRSPHPINLIRFHEMDIIGTKEGLYTQVEDIQKEFGFPYIGIGAHLEEERESCAVYYDPEKYELLDEGTFSLPKSAENPLGSSDEASNRICSWGKFQSPEGDYFYVFNVHYTHLGTKARVESSKLLLKKIQEINKDHLPCIVTGDFTVEDNSDVYQELLEGHHSEKRPLFLVTSEGTYTTFPEFLGNISGSALSLLLSSH
ncbi:endonuclease [Cyclobacterium xiamenense]|uniref:endonuclease n=1 Tax=Cyclobacterium xiamenense TaxID=1297121 RepID=UPI0035CF5979